MASPKEAIAGAVPRRNAPSRDPQLDGSDAGKQDVSDSFACVTATLAEIPHEFRSEEEAAYQKAPQNPKDRCLAYSCLDESECGTEDPFEVFPSDSDCSSEADSEVSGGGYALMAPGGDLPSDSSDSMVGDPPVCMAQRRRMAETLPEMPWKVVDASRI